MLKFNVASAEGASRKFLEMAQLDAANSMPGQLDAADSTPGLFSCKTIAIIRVRARVRVSIELAWHRVGGIEAYPTQILAFFKNYFDFFSVLILCIG